VTRLASLLSLAILLAGCAAKPADTFSPFVEDFFRAGFEFRPSSGTAVGFHEYDQKFEDYSAAAFLKRIGSLHEFSARLARLRESKLSDTDSIDAELIDSAIKSELLDLETLQSWKQNPMGYVALPGEQIDGLMKRNFAPPKDRLRSVIARLKGVPALLAAMRDNVANPPKEFTDIAVRMAEGSTGFFKDSIAGWAKDAAAGDDALLKEFAAANTPALEAMREAAGWLKRDLLPKSHGKFAIGAENFSRKLLYDDMVDLPLDRILSIGEANLAKDFAAFVETAKRVAPGKTPMQAMSVLNADHPAEADLLASAKRTIDSARQFLIDKQIVTLPNELRPSVRETPPFERSGNFASMDTPGPFETKATEAFYYITPPEKEWDAKHKEEHLRLFNKSVMDMITIHEVFPGHFTQFLYASQFPTKTRKLTGANTNIEGWAHYGEQMMLEEGFGGGDPKIRLAQLSEALLRDCRYVAGIKMHTQGMTVEEGARLFVEKGAQQPANAYEEARRGTYNPTYLYYTLGKLQIYKLREDYKRAKGAAFTLRGFHEFVKAGPMPLKLMRRVMLPGDAGSVL
jgi:uncharacterized protein (DUF885 family)